MSLHDMAIADNALFFAEGGFAVCATFQSADLQDSAKINCFFVSIDEKKDLQVGDAQGFVRRSFRQIAVASAELPAWFDQKSSVFFEGDLGVCYVERIAHDNTLGRVHVWLKEQSRPQPRGAM